MSGERSGSPILTVTFSSVLNHNLLLLTDALNRNDYYETYSREKTIILMLKEEDQKKLLKNEIAHVDHQLSVAMKTPGVDLYTTRRQRKASVEAILRRNVSNIFHKIMLTLHAKGYLEKQPVKPRAKGSGRLKINE